MRALLFEVLAIAFVAIVVICVALGMLPGSPDTTWISRADDLLRTAFTLNFSNARWANPSAFAVISRAALISVTIVAATGALLILIGVPLGIASVTHSESAVVRSLRKAVSVVSSVPILVTGTLIYVVFGRQFHITLRDDTSLIEAMAAAIVAVTLGDRLLSDIVQHVELTTRAVLAEPYMRAVRAANLGFTRHLLQSMVPPVAEVFAARAMFLISGAIVAEFVFTVHGLGLSVLLAVATNDDTRKILALGMALIAIGLCFRVLHRGAIALADGRQRA